jgi:hypothetical protein
MVFLYYIKPIKYVISIEVLIHNMHTISVQSLRFLGSKHVTVNLSCRYEYLIFSAVQCLWVKFVGYAPKYSHHHRTDSFLTYSVF